MNTRFSKTIMALAIVCLLSAGNAFAQKQNGGRDWQTTPSVEDKLARISGALDLSDEQSMEMLQILQEQERQRLALHEQTMALMGPEICAQRANHEEAILAILTAEQAGLFQQHTEQRRDRAGRKGSSRGANGPDCPD